MTTGKMMEAAAGWPWMAVEVSRYVHLVYTVFVMIFMAHIITIFIISCSRKKDVKKILLSEKNTGSVSCRLPQPQNQAQQPPQQQQQTSKDKINSNEKDKPPPPASSAKPGSELPADTTQLSKDGIPIKTPSINPEKKEPEKLVPKAKELLKPQHSSNLKADQECSNNRLSSNSKVSAAIGVNQSDVKSDRTQSEVDKTQSSKTTKSKRSSKRNKLGGK